jgi:hypothetical protein
MLRSWANTESTKYGPCLQAHYSSLGPARGLATRAQKHQDGGETNEDSSLTFTG